MNPSHDHNDLESQLRSLTPAPSALDRDAMLFEAGRASARQNIGRWRGACGLLGTLLVAGVLFHVQPPTRPSEMRVDQTPAPPSTNIALDSAPALEVAAYLQLRTRVLEQGMDALNDDRAPRRTTKPAKPLAPRPLQQLLEEML